MRDKYATVKIPIELALKLDEISENLGYRSRAEAVKDAIRRFIEAKTSATETKPVRHEELLELSPTIKSH